MHRREGPSPQGQSPPCSGSGQPWARQGPPLTQPLAEVTPAELPGHRIRGDAQTHVAHGRLTPFPGQSGAGGLSWALSEGLGTGLPPNRHFLCGAAETKVTWKLPSSSGRLSPGPGLEEGSESSTWDGILQNREAEKGWGLWAAPGWRKRGHLCGARAGVLLWEEVMVSQRGPEPPVSGRDDAAVTCFAASRWPGAEGQAASFLRMDESGTRAPSPHRKLLLSTLQAEQPDDSTALHGATRRDGLESLTLTLGQMVLSWGSEGVRMPSLESASQTKEHHYCPENPAVAPRALGRQSPSQAMARQTRAASLLPVSPLTPLRAAASVPPPGRSLTPSPPLRRLLSTLPV